MDDNYSSGSEFHPCYENDDLRYKKVIPIESARKRLVRKNEEQDYDEILQRFLDHEEQLDW